jgi:hypothetical protein
LRIINFHAILSKRLNPGFLVNLIQRVLSDKSDEILYFADVVSWKRLCEGFSDRRFFSYFIIANGDGYKILHRNESSAGPINGKK